MRIRDSTHSLKLVSRACYAQRKRHQHQDLAPKKSTKKNAAEEVPKLRFSTVEFWGSGGNLVWTLPCRLIFFLVFVS